VFFFFRFPGAGETVTEKKNGWIVAAPTEKAAANFDAQKNGLLKRKFPIENGFF